MTTRTEDAERLGTLVGLYLVYRIHPEEKRGLIGFMTFGHRKFDFPAPDAPLHAHLAFVGELAEAAGLRLLEINKLWDDGWQCRLANQTGMLDWICDAPDLAHAAVRAALAARGEG